MFPSNPRTPTCSGPPLHHSFKVLSNIMEMASSNGRGPRGFGSHDDELTLLTQILCSDAEAQKDEKVRVPCIVFYVLWGYGF